MANWVPQPVRGCDSDDHPSPYVSTDLIGYLRQQKLNKQVNTLEFRGRDGDPNAVLTDFGLQGPQAGMRMPSTAPSVLSTESKTSSQVLSRYSRSPASSVVVSMGSMSLDDNRPPSLTNDGSSNLSRSLAGTGEGMGAIDRIQGGLPDDFNNLPIERRCPMHFLKCFKTFTNQDQWETHFKSHFDIRRLPSVMTCPFHCQYSFNGNSGVESWEEMITHIDNCHHSHQVDMNKKPSYILITNLRQRGIIKDYQDEMLQKFGKLVDMPVIQNERSGRPRTSRQG